MKQGVVYTFGEVLWDELPTGKIPGGAPMNVAIHCSNLGMDAHVISCIGQDLDGERICSFMEERGVNTSAIHRHESARTGYVTADVSDPSNVHYTIHEDVAWDHIDWKQVDSNAVERADYFVFGSLACRSDKNRDSLHHLLAGKATRVFDVNLRAPYYSPEALAQLLEAAHIVKMNEEEMLQACQWYGITQGSESLAGLAERFALRGICLTKGAQGASYYTGGETFEGRGFPVKVKDTIGSGDAFLAAFIARLHEAPSDIQIALEYASAVGALVATHAGANPHITQEAIQRLMAETPAGINHQS